MSNSLSRERSTVIPAPRVPILEKDSKLVTATASAYQLPVEILNTIFIEVVTNPAKGSTPHMEQNTIMAVNRHWHDVILATPEAWRHFWIRPYPDETAFTMSPSLPRQAKGWLGIEEAKLGIQWAMLGPYADLPISILVDLSGAKFVPDRRISGIWMELRWQVVQLLCSQKLMALWKSVQVWDPLPALFAKDFVQLASTGPVSPYLETLSVEFPREEEIKAIDDGVISAFQICPWGYTGRGYNPQLDEGNFEVSPLKKLHLPSIRLMPLFTSPLYSNLVSLRILDNLCDTCRDGDGNYTYVLLGLLDLCPRLRDLGLRCSHPQTDMKQRASTMELLRKLGLSGQPFDMLPHLMPNPGVTVHEGIRTLLIYGPTFRCPAIESFRFPCVEEVNVKGWVDNCDWAPSLPFPPPGTANGPKVKLIP
ncbi:hypothetical protein FRC04_007301 [Tulasnella sp. 424]|nr:hypothetical protein FRC04_007301 [Tulasnella sp. 424]